MLTDDDIKRLWLDPKSPIAYSGIRNVKLLLKTTYGEDVSASRIHRILSTIPNYIYQLKAPKRYPTRSYDVHSFGSLLELDLGFMHPFNNFIGFLLGK